MEQKPAQLLARLLEQPGEVVTRDELVRLLWPGEQHGDFDQRLNKAVHKIRCALGDDPANPRFIQTLSRYGHRFIADVEFKGRHGRSAPESAPVVAKQNEDLQPIPPVEIAATGDEAKAEPEPGTRRGGVWWKIGAGALVAIALVLVASWGLKRTRPAIPFRTHDYLLIADFDNRTGDPKLDGAVETVLRRELNNSAFLSVVPFVRIDDALLLMKKPSSTRITPEIAREVSLRDGGIGAILTGRIQKLGSEYEIDVFVTSPTEDAPSYALGETAKTQSDLPAGIHRLSVAIRRRLGENAAQIRTSEEKLERVTTPSLEALQLYSEGEREAELWHWPEAEQLFRAALARDPHFASAMAMLSWALRYQGSAPRSTHEHEELLELTEKANRLAGTTSNREANFIRGTYFYFRNDQERAIAAFKAVLQFYPNDFWSAKTLIRIEKYRSDDVDASILAHRMAVLRPNDPQSVSFLWAEALEKGDAKEANAYSERLNTFDRAGALPKNIAAAIAWQPVLRSASSGDVAGAMQEANHVLALADAGLLDASVAGSAANFFTSIGRLSDAEKWAGAVRDTGWKLYSQEYVAAHRGDGGIQLMRVLQRIQQYSPHSTLAPRFAARDLAYVGRFREARAAFARVSTSGPPTLADQAILDELFEGAIERGEGNLDGAIPKLQDSRRRYEAAGNRYAVIYASETLARALDARGDTAGAIAVLEPLERDPRFDFGGIAPTEARFLLSTLYRKAGRIDDARKVEAELLGLLRFADPDYPVLVALKRQVAQ